MRQSLISDHAVLCFLERRYGFDFERVRGEMLTPTVEASILAGAVQVTAHGGRMVIRDGRVVSFLPGTSRKRKRVGKGI
jgi:hypothetical protein